MSGYQPVGGPSSGGPAPGVRSAALPPHSAAASDFAEGPDYHYSDYAMPDDVAADGPGVGEYQEVGEPETYQRYGVDPAPAVYEEAEYYDAPPAEDYGGDAVVSEEYTQYSTTAVGGEMGGEESHATATSGHSEASEPIDAGIVPCNEAFLQSTLGVFPASYDVANRSALQCGIVCQPLAELCGEGVDSVLNDVSGVPRVNFNSCREVARCRSCRGYMNCFAEWLNSGAQWRCCLCLAVNECEKAYFAELDRVSGRRIDFMEPSRAELRHGCYEIEAPAEYCVRPPQPTSYCFLLNVNRRAVDSGMLQTVCDSLLSALDFMQDRDPRCVVSFVTYHSTIQLYSFAPMNATATMDTPTDGAGDDSQPVMSGGTAPSVPTIHEVLDIDDPMLPEPALGRYLVNLKDNRKAVQFLLESLPTMYSGVKSEENAFGSAADLAFRTIRDVGGKIVAFSYGLPKVGLGKLSDRSKDPKLTGGGTDAAKLYHLLLKRANTHFVDLGLECVKFQVNCDVFQFSDAVDDYNDVATMKSIARCGGGQFRYFERFSTSRHGAVLSGDVLRLIRRSSGWEAVMRLRCSKGLNVKQHFGCYHKRASDLLILPSLDADKSITCLLQHNASFGLRTASAFVQSALLYTSSTGQRRIRVQTLAIPISSSLPDLFGSLRVACNSALVAKQACLKMFSQDVAHARVHIQDTCLTALHRCAKLTSIGSLASEKEYPSALQLWPLSTLGLLKCAAFADVTDVRNWLSVDARCALLVDVLSMGVAAVDLLMRPQLLLLSELLEDAALGDYGEGEVAPYLPSEVQLTAAALGPADMYLLDNGQELVLWLGPDVAKHRPDVVSLLFEKESGKSLRLRPRGGVPPDSDELFLLDRVWNVIDYLRAVNYRMQPLRVLQLGFSPMADAMFATVYLIRDRTDSVMEYNEFLRFIYEHSIQPLDESATT